MDNACSLISPSLTNEYIYLWALIVSNCINGRVNTHCIYVCHSQNAIVAQSKNCPFGVNIMIDLKNITTLFTISEPCTVIHIREKDQQDAHFFLIIYFT